MPSPYSEKTQEPLEHAVLIQADPAGQSAAVGMLSPSDCYPVGPAGPYVAGGPLGPDVWFKDPEPLTVGTRSPSDCYPAGPYVAGGPVGPGDCLQVLEPFQQLVLDHADPAGQHAVILDTAEPLEHAWVENILDGRPMEGITCPELLEYSLRLLDATLEVDSLRRYQIGSRKLVRFRTLPWTVDLGRGILTWSIRLRGCPWTVDSWRGCRVWSHWSSRFLIRCWSHDLVNVSRRKDQIGSR